MTTSSDPQVGLVPPALPAATVEKIVINAVIAVRTMVGEVLAPAAETAGPRADHDSSTVLGSNADMVRG